MSIDRLSITLPLDASSQKYTEVNSKYITDLITTNNQTPYLETPHFPTKDTQSKSTCSFFYKDIDSKEELIKASNIDNDTRDTETGDNKPKGSKERCHSFHHPKTKSFDSQIPHGLLSKELFEKRKSIFEPSSNKQCRSSLRTDTKEDSTKSLSIDDKGVKPQRVFDQLSIDKENNMTIGGIQEDIEPIKPTIDLRKTLKRTKERTDNDNDNEKKTLMDIQIDFSKIMKGKRGKGKNLKDYTVFIDNQAENYLTKTETEKTNVSSIIEPKKTSLSRNNSCDLNGNGNGNANVNDNSNNNCCIMIPQYNDNGLMTFKAEQIEKVFQDVKKVNTKPKVINEIKTPINNIHCFNATQTKTIMKSNYQYAPKSKTKTKRLSYEKTNQSKAYSNKNYKPVIKQSNNKNSKLKTKSLNKEPNYLINQFDGNPIYSYNKDNMNTNTNIDSNVHIPKTIRNETNQSLYHLLVDIQKKCIDSTTQYQLKENELNTEIQNLKYTLDALTHKEIQYKDHFNKSSSLHKPNPNQLPKRGNIGLYR